MNDTNDTYFMKRAITKARQGIKKGQTPFGACLVKDGKIISCQHNTVWQTTDITAHAEINVIHAACKKFKTIDLAGCTLYSTCEPCPMCFSACHWAQIKRIVYGTKISDARRAGFHELTIANNKLKKLGHSSITIKGGVLHKDNLALFNFWSSQKNKKTY